MQKRVHAQRLFALTSLELTTARKLVFGYAQRELGELVRGDLKAIRRAVAVVDDVEGSITYLC